MPPDGAVGCVVVVVVVVGRGRGRCVVEPGADDVVDAVLKVPSLEVAAPSLEAKLASPEYVASAVVGQARPRQRRGDLARRDATRHGDGVRVEVVALDRPTPSMVNVTYPVGVAVLEASPATTFARSVGVVESTSVTAERLVLESDCDADAAGNEPQTTGASAKARPAASAGTRQRRMGDLRRGRHGIRGIPLGECHAPF